MFMYKEKKEFVCLTEKNKNAYKKVKECGTKRFLTKMLVLYNDTSEKVPCGKTFLLDILLEKIPKTCFMNAENVARQVLDGTFSDNVSKYELLLIDNLEELEGRRFAQIGVGKAIQNYLNGGSVILACSVKPESLKDFFDTVGDSAELVPVAPPNSEERFLIAKKVNIKNGMLDYREKLPVSKLREISEKYTDVRTMTFEIEMEREKYDPSESIGKNTKKKKHSESPENNTEKKKSSERFDIFLEILEKIEQQYGKKCVNLAMEMEKAGISELTKEMERKIIYLRGMSTDDPLDNWGSTNLILNENEADIKERCEEILFYIQEEKCPFKYLIFPIDIIRQYWNYFEELGFDEIQKHDAIWLVMNTENLVKNIDEAKEIVARLSIFELSDEIRKEYICYNIRYLFDSHSRKDQWYFGMLCEEYGEEDGFEFLCRYADAQSKYGGIGEKIHHILNSF